MDKIDFPSRILKNFKRLITKIAASIKPLNEHPALIKITFLLLALLYLFFVIQRAWVAEDAFINFRTIDNFLHGYGLTWNTFERVQAFTTPLWVFVLTFVVALTQEYFYTTMVVSILLSAAILFVLYRFSLRSVAATFLVFSLLITSAAYLDFSTSGLDNALSHFLIALFILLLIRLKPSRRKLFLVSLIACFGLCNRMDSGVIFLPGIIYLFYENRAFKDWWLALVAQTPFIAWELFSLIYYGFPFPNTAYAKLYTGIAKEAYIRQGWLYLIDSFLHDPTTLMACLITFFFALKSPKKPIQYVLPFSMGLYILYDIQIGGDFMRGRFLTLPLLCAVLIVITIQNKYISRFGIFIALFFVLLNINSPSPFYKSNIVGKLTRDGIANERGFFLNSNSLIKKISMPEIELPFHRWAEEGKHLRLNPPESGAVVCDAIGMNGFFAGPDVKIIDRLGLSDPLLARLPIKDKIYWQIGHFRREIPIGYVETVASGVNKISDKNIAAYYEKLKIVTRDPLFSPGRIKTILEMNFGAYEYLIR